MALHRCPKCRLPLRLSRNYVWAGNGTIFSRRDPTMRMAVFDAGYYPYLWSELESRLGTSVADIMIRGQRAAMQDYLRSNIIYGWRRKIVQAVPLLVVRNRILKEMTLFGFGRLEILEFQRGKSLVMRLQHPFDIISLAWGIKGFFEFLAQASSKLGWVKDGEDFILSITVLPAKQADEPLNTEAQRAVRDAKRELATVQDRLPGRIEQWDTCPACGLPSVLTAMEWREDEGTIYNRDTGRRFIFTSGHILLGMLREMQGETREGIDSVLFEITRDFYLHRMRELPDMSKADFYRAAAERISACGFGEVLDYFIGEGHLEITVGNPFHVPRLAGRIAAMFEYIEGMEAKMDLRSSRADYLELELRTT